MRGQFQNKLSNRPHLFENINLVAADATSFGLGRTFPTAFLSGSFDHLLNDQERLSALANIARQLRPGGKLIFDAFLGLMGDSPLSLTDRVTQRGREYRRSVGTNVLEGGRQETHLVYETYQSGKLIERIEERSLVGIIDRERLHRLLRQSGFRVNREFGDYDCIPFRKGEKLLIIEAAKA